MSDPADTPPVTIAATTDLAATTITATATTESDTLLRIYDTMI